MVVKKATKIWGGVGLALVVAVVVCFGLVLVNSGKTGENLTNAYAELRKEVEVVSRERNVVEEFLNLKITEAKLDKEEKEVVTAFEEIGTEGNAIQKWLESEACNDEKVKALVNDALKLYENVQSLYSIEQDLAVMFDGELSDDDIAELKKSENSYLKEMANDLGAYRVKVKGLSAKDKDFLDKHDSLVVEGKKLEQKYANADLETIIGKSQADILKFYDKLDELNKYLVEQEK